MGQPVAGFRLGAVPRHGPPHAVELATGARTRSKPLSSSAGFGSSTDRAASRLARPESLEGATTSTDLTRRAGRPGAPGIAGTAPDRLTASAGLGRRDADRHRRRGRIRCRGRRTGQRRRRTPGAGVPHHRACDPSQADRRDQAGGPGERRAPAAGAGRRPPRRARAGCRTPGAGFAAGRAAPAARSSGPGARRYRRARPGRTGSPRDDSRSRRTGSGSAPWSR